MKYTIDEEVCKNAHLDIHLLLTILLLNTGTKFEDNLKELIDREIIIEDKSLLGTRFLITKRWANIVSEILCDSERDNPKEFDERLENLAIKMMEIFPKGKKEGTNKYWKGNLRDVKQKLKAFFKKYGDKYSDEQILEATQSYVDSHNGNYTFMRVLQYFIFKDERRVGGDEASDLATILDNAGQANDRIVTDNGRLV